MKRFLLPLIVFFALIGFLARGLFLDPREVPTALKNKAAPSFNLAQLNTPEKTFSPHDMVGQVWLLNVWATWCGACREEHPELMELAKTNMVPIVGLSYKEVRDDTSLDMSKINPAMEKDLAIGRVNDWYKFHGNPYTLSVLDIDGRVGIDYGVYAVPETFVIDKRGVIRMKHIGAITPDIFTQKLLPLIQELNRA